MDNGQAERTLNRLITVAESDMSKQLIADARASLRWLCGESARRGLTLVTLCDMALGEDAVDRNDDALVRAVGQLQRDARQMAKLISTSEWSRRNARDDETLRLCAKYTDAAR